MSNDNNQIICPNCNKEIKSGLINLFLLKSHLKLEGGEVVYLKPTYEVSIINIKVLHINNFIC